MKLIRNQLILTFGELEDLYRGFKELELKGRDQICMIILPKESKQ